MHEIRKNRVAYALLLPSFVPVLMLVIWPLIDGIWLGFEQKHMLWPGTRFVGLRNYLDLAKDAVYRTALVNTLVWTVCSVVLILAIGLGLALLLNLRLRWIGLFRSLVLIPWILPAAVVALMWNVMFWEDYGILNSVLRHIGVISSNVRWLSDPRIALLSCVIAFSWWRIPFASIMLLAGLQVIPAELYEASEIDGASAFHRFRYVTLPLVNPVLLTVFLVTTIWAVDHFPIVAILTGGGPANSSELLSTLSYATAFNYLDIGRAAATANTMLLLLLPLGFFYARRMSL